MKKFYIIIFFLAISYFAFAQNNLRSETSVGIPILVGMDYGSDCYTDGHTFSFKLESLTEGAPMPANDIVSIEAPTKPGVANIKGYEAEDEDNPWRMSFLDGTWNYRITQLTDLASPSDSLDQGTWLVSMHIDSNSDPKWEITFAQYSNSSIAMDEDSFLIVKKIGSGQYETAAEVEVDENGRTRLQIGGDGINDQDDENAFNVAVIKSKFAVDFTKNFSVFGTLTPQQTATPEGSLIGFIASTTEPTPDDLMSDGNLGIYYNETFKNGIVLEFDSYPNELYSTEPEYKHFGMMRVNEVGFPKSTFQYYDMTEYWPDESSNYYIINDVSARTLTFKLRLPNNTIQTYVYTNPRLAFDNATEAYFIMSGVIRRGPSGSYGLGEFGSESPSLEFFFDSFSYLGHKEGFEEIDCIFVNYLKHEWIYSAEDNTLHAICSHDNGDPENNGCTSPGIKTLVLTAEDMNHDGSVYDRATYTTDEWTPSGINVPTIEYAGVGLTTYPKSVNAPSQCGTYEASATVEDVTATDGFMIRPSVTYSADPHCTATVTLNDGTVVPSGTYVDPYTTLTATATVDDEIWNFTNWTKGNGGAFLTDEQTFTFVISCDTLLHANVERDPYLTQIYDTICSNEKYKKHGFDIGPFEPGMHYDTLFLTSSVYGCDSIVALELKVHPAYTIEFFDTICQGNGYHQHGFDLDSLDLEVGMNYDTIYLATTALGCDSIKTLSLLVAPVYDTNLYDTICYGEDYHGYNFDTINPEVGLCVMQQELYSTFGCDSIVTMYLSVNETFNFDFIDTTCSFAGYHEHGFDIDTLEPGMYYDTLFLTTTSGCDSIITLELTVNTSYSFKFADTTCYGDGYHQHGFELDSLALGMHYDTLFWATTSGCDSTIMLELYVAPIYDSTFYDTICYGNGYYEHGFEIDSLSLEVGMNYDTLFLATTLGCDSTIMLRLYVAPVYDTNLYDTICYGEDYHGYNFDTINPEPGLCVMQQSLLTSFGCDSIVTMNLLVGDVYAFNFSDTTCVNEGYYQHGFVFDSLELGWRYDTLFLSSIYGCDSTIMLELYVAPIYDTTFEDTICSGHDYYEHGFEIDHPAVGMNYDTLFLKTTLGCDSLVYLRLYVTLVYDITFYDTICYGEEYHNHGFDFENPQVGMNYDTLFLATTLGCDSIVKMQLFVGDVYDIYFRDTICYGEDYDKYNFHLVQPSVGIHEETQSLNTIYGCDSIVNLRLTVAEVYRAIVLDTICEGEDYNDHGIFIAQPLPGDYDTTSYLKTIFGCDSIFDLKLNVMYTYVTPDTIIGEREVLVATNLIPGTYFYSIDTIPGCDEIFWSVSTHDWELSSEYNVCKLIVTTPTVQTLTMMASNACGMVTKSIEISASYFGVGENENVNVNVYPNPSSGYVNVESNGVEVINILSATGVVVKRFKFDDENLVSIDISDLPNAVYMLEIVTRDGKCMRRITKTAY